MIVLKKKAKVIAAVFIFGVICIAGFAVEYLERDAFIMETVATEDALPYHSESESSIDGRININSAGEEELMELDGIGKAFAGRIIAYREENGAFATPEEIMKVSGISEKKFEKIKDDICAE